MPNIVSRIVEVTVFKKSSGSAQYLLLKRSDGDRLFPGIWQIVTGEIEDGEQAIPAAVRELGEETGLKPLRLWRLPLVNSFYEPGRDLLHFCPNFTVLVDEHSEPLLSTEHQSFRWCSREEALELLPWSGQRQAVKVVDERFAKETEESRLLEIHQHS